MEQANSVRHIEQSPSPLEGEEPEVTICKVTKKRVRLIRKCKVQQKTYHISRARKNASGLSNTNNTASTSAQSKSQNQGEKNVHSLQNQNPSAPNNQIQSGTLTQKLILKIEFQPVCLPLRYQQLYAKKQKLKNTDLILPGVKFVTQLSMHGIDNWQKTLIIYQTHYSASNRCHFGLLLKYGRRIITFDGIAKLWPLLRVERSYHWQEQPDTWSCGYRVLFWVDRIKEKGIDLWVKDNELQEVQYDY